MSAIARHTAPAAATRQQISITGLLWWAFGREFARLDFDELASVSGGGLPGIGMEYVMIERARLGCRVDGGGRSDPHPDADQVASVLAVLPEGCGGRGMALRVAELARTGRVPDWMPDPKPSCKPREWKRSKHGWFGAREYCTATGIRWRSDMLGRDDGYWCPVTYTDTAHDIAIARRGYLLWWGALLEMQSTFRAGCLLAGFEVTNEMPKRTPWKKG